MAVHNNAYLRVLCMCKTVMGYLRENGQERVLLNDDFAGGGFRLPAR